MPELVPIPIIVGLLFAGFIFGLLIGGIIKKFLYTALLAGTIAAITSIYVGLSFPQHPASGFSILIGIFAGTIVLLLWIKTRSSH